MNEYRHSGLGIASFVTSLSAAVLMFATIIVAGVLESNTPGGMDEDATSTMLVGCGVLSLGLVQFIGLGLGIASLCQRERKKVFGILGTIVSAGTLLIVAGLMIIGLAAG